MITKKLIVVNGMTGQEMPVRVEEGATPADILKQIGLPNYQLATVRNRQVLQHSCDVSRVVDDRERLFAFAPMVVGCSL
jgi:sulfur carrier protein ThiS